MQTPAQQRPFETVMAVIRVTSILLGVYWLAIFIATHLPSRSLPSVGSDKVYHLIAFGGLGAMLSWTLSLWIRGGRLHAAVVLMIALVYAAFDEWSQQFVVGRQPDIMDVAADACGAVLGLVGFWMLRSILTSEVRLAKQPS